MPLANFTEVNIVVLTCTIMLNKIEEICIYIYR